MIRDLFLWLLTVFVVEPVQTEWTNRLQAAGATPQVIARLSDCARQAGPALATRAAEEPFWGITTAITVATGMRDGLTVVTEAVPACAGPIADARAAAAGRST